MGVDLAFVLGHSLGAAELLAFPERASASLEMQRAARMASEDESLNLDRSCYLSRSLTLW
ncbi:hypothetical protein WME73_43310 [Sorangium sp. So ce302]|uniref:hypothetical protein n=1 Tax=unclassified Sorangium TaxID=2621164 RepID=UPI003F62CED7